MSCTGCSIICFFLFFFLGEGGGFIKSIFFSLLKNIERLGAS